MTVTFGIWTGNVSNSRDPCSTDLGLGISGPSGPVVSDFRHRISAVRALRCMLVDLNQPYGP